MSTDLTQLSNVLRNFSVNDLVLVLKESQLKTQELQEEICQLKTAVPSNKNPPDISTSDILSDSSASGLTSSKKSKKSKALFESKESQVKLNYVVCRMVFFGNIWWETKELSGSALEYDVAICKLNSAVVALHAAPHSCQKALQEHVTVLRIIIKLHEYLLPVYHPLIGAMLDGKYYKMFKLWLLGYDEVKKQYKWLPPCLFAEGRISGATMFRVSVGVKILLSMLWGKGALDKTKITSRKTNATLWEVTEVNASCIAFVTIVIQYLLAGDGDFDSPGNRSSIDYDADFEYYLERIKELIQEGTKSSNKKWWEIEDSPDDFDNTSTSLAFTPQITVAVQANTHNASASQPAQSIALPTSAITAATEIEHMELQPTEPTVLAVPVKEKRGKKGKKTTAVATVAPRAPRATRSTRQVTFEDEEIAARRITQGNGATGLVPSVSGSAAPVQATFHALAGTSVTACSMTSDVISVSVQYDEYDEQEEDEETEE
ncbi:hypothetical protein EV421DRAFT_1739132 [Armillaria borealis]|uniref:Uncharacterized protein n=1 Tax=Armillaria borealis TaxID=47425 RepID=A0AA39J6W1_9AGAR|nr:hypothetical protein EV421DRAFT_1739132 [Armillaria borealis]